MYRRLTFTMVASGAWILMYCTGIQCWIWTASKGLGVDHNLVISRIRPCWRHRGQGCGLEVVSELRTENMLIRWKKDKGSTANSSKSSTKKKRKFGREGECHYACPHGIWCWEVELKLSDSFIGGGPCSELWCLVDWFCRDQITPSRYLVLC